MDKQRLHDTLEQLHSELQQIESVDENERQVLQSLLADITKLTGSRGQEPQHAYERLCERLKEGI